MGVGAADADGAVAVVSAVTAVGGGAVGASLGLTVLQLALFAGVYVWTALALRAVFAKVGQPAWKAWTPVVNLWTLFELAGMKGWWAVVQVAAGVIVTIVASITGALFLAAAQDAAFSGSSASAAGALAGAAAVPLILYSLFGVGVLILQVRMMRPLNRGFGLGPGYVALGTLVLPLWASIVGWGAATWRGVPKPGIPPTPFAAASPVAPATVDTSSFAPPAPSAAVSTPSTAVSAAPAAVSAASVPAPAPPAPWGPPAAPPRVGAFADPPAVDGADGVDEHTVLAAHRRASPALRLPDGTTVPLTGGDAVLGRNPIAPGEAPDAQRVAIDDVTRTVSKTHALLRRSAAGWTITDLSSTNGVVVGEGDDEIPVAVPTPVTGRFLLGDAEFSLDPGTR